MAPAATMLKLLFKVKPGVQLFREKRLPAEEEFKNKLGYTRRSRVAILTGTNLETTSDLKELLDGPIDSEIAALGYSDFIIKWQDYFKDLPYCVQLQPFHKDLRAEEKTGADEERRQKLDAVLHPKVHHAKTERQGDDYIINRTLGVAGHDNGLQVAIWTSRETINEDGTYKMELLDKLYEEPVAGDLWTNLPRWFGKR